MAPQTGRDARLVGEPDRAAAPAALWLISAFSTSCLSTRAGSWPSARGTFLYAELLLTEGVGLLLRRRWAEYFTVIFTGSFIPLELYELTRRICVLRFVVLAVNVAIVWYLLAVMGRPASAGRVGP